MTISAILLITLSAFIHAFWNFLSKRQNPSSAFFLIASIVSAILIAPLLIVYLRGLPYFTVADWILVVATGICQALYYVGLSGAYRNGDLSLAYPLARALPVLWVALVSLALGRGSQIGGLAFIGFLMVAAGCLILPLPNFGELKLKYYMNICCLFAALAAIGTTGYTLIDDQVLRNLRTAAGIPLARTQITLLFMALENVSLTTALGVYVCLSRSDFRILRSTWKTTWLSAGAAGLMMTGAYGLVLLAMAFVTNVSYVSAFRQLSLPIGVFLGMIVHREPRYLPRLTGLAVILAGLAMITLG
jgi:drug/metabolite transporter (DMT)-like permease